MTLTSSELIVLGLLIERPRHGYALDRTIAERGIRQWADLAFSSIYYLLTKLESRGLVRTGASEGQKSRRVFSPTDEGRRAAAAAATEALRDAQPAFSPFVVGLANLDLVSDADVRACLAERSRTLAIQIAAVETARAAQGRLPSAAGLVFSHSLAMLVAERDWLAAIEQGDAPS